VLLVSLFPADTEKNVFFSDRLFAFCNYVRVHEIS
jgi:hypothetical protein